MPRDRVRIVMPYEDGYLLEELLQPGSELLGRVRFPGGAIEHRETAREALFREMQEELSRNLPIKKAVFLGHVKHPKWDFTEYYYWLSNHGLKPGVYDAKVEEGKIPHTKLVVAQPIGPKYFGPDVMMWLRDRK